MLTPGRSTTTECLEALAAAQDQAQAREASLAFVRAPDLFGRAHLLRPARRAWEEAYAQAWVEEAGLPSPEVAAPAVEAYADCTSGQAYPIDRAPYARTLAEVAERGRHSGRLPRPGRRPR